LVASFWQFHYTIYGEELSIILQEKMPYLCGLWRFANAYLYYRRRRWKMEDNQIIELYWQRNEEAIKETQAKYGSYC
jgi:hypothetical protein